MDMTLDRYLEERYQACPHRLSLDRPLSGALDWTTWRAQLRTALRGRLCMAPAVPLDLEVLSTTRRDHFTQLKVAYNVEAGLRAPAYLLLPDGATHAPCVVALHGHGAGVRPIIGLAADDSEAGAPDYQAAFALALVRRGFVVAAPELAGFGDLRLSEDVSGPPEQSSCHRLSVYLTMLGRTLAGLRTAQALRMLDVLAERPEADAGRAGMIGISGGGTVTTLASVLDERIRASVVCSYANTFHDSILAMHHCVDNYLPGWLQDAEMPDLLAAIAPRPMLWESGVADPIYPAHGVQAAFFQVQKAYEAQGVADRLAWDAFPGGHAFSGRRSLDFLQTWL